MYMIARLMGAARTVEQRAARRVRLVRGATLGWTLLVVLYFAIEVWSYSGVFAKLSEWQFTTFDQSWPMASFLLLVAVFSLPAFLVLVLFGMQPAPENEADAEVFHARRTMHALRVFGFCFALAALACLVPTVNYPGHDGPLREIHAGQRSDDRSFDGPARLFGTVLMSRMATLNQNLILTQRQLRLAPLLPVANEKVVRYLVQVTPTEVEADRIGKAPPHFDGVLVRQGLPGSLRVLYEGAGIGLVDAPLVLYRNPSTTYRPYRVAAAQFALMALAALIGWLWQRRHVKRLIARGPRQRAREHDTGMILSDDAGLRPISVVLQEAAGTPG